jgi:acyl-CoA reductase-like NAD-dependent aldehyde dehydrogenase
VQQEIFGPLLPGLLCAGFVVVVGVINPKQKSLGLCIFSKDPAAMVHCLSRVSFGDGWVN